MVWNWDWIIIVIVTTIISNTSNVRHLNFIISTQSRQNQLHITFPKSLYSPRRFITLHLLFNSQDEADDPLLHTCTCWCRSW